LLTDKLIETLDVMEGDDRLRQIVWTEQERLDFGGEKAATLSHRTKKKLARARRDGTQKWKAMNDAVGEVEEEIEMEDTTAALDELAVGQAQKLAWTEDLADRTRH
jgi:hypothetical protein